MNIKQTVLQEALDSLMGQVALLSSSVTTAVSNIYYQVSVEGDDPRAELPEVDVFDRGIEIEDGVSFDASITGQGTIERLNLDGLYSASIRSYLSVDRLGGDDLGGVNLSLPSVGKVDFSDVYGSFIRINRLLDEIDAEATNTTIAIGRVSDGADISVYGENVTVSWQDGDAEYYGAGGNHQVSAGDEDDKIETRDGNDVISGNGGADTVFSGIGDDEVRGGEGRDRLDGGSGNDTMIGGNGDDVLVGGDGDDILNGQAGKNYISAGNGADALMGSGSDTLDGGAGADQFLFTLKAGEVAQINTGWDQNHDQVIINNIGVEGTLAMHLGTGDTAIGYTGSGVEFDLAAFYAAAAGENFMIGNTTFTDDVFGGKG